MHAQINTADAEAEEFSEKLTCEDSTFDDVAGVLEPETGWSQLHNNSNNNHLYWLWQRTTDI